MPTYEFECEKCKKPFTVGQTLREYDQHEKPKCPRCGSRVVRQRVTSVHVQTGKKADNPGDVGRSSSIDSSDTYHRIVARRDKMPRAWHCGFCEKGPANPSRHTNCGLTNPVNRCLVN